MERDKFIFAINVEAFRNRLRRSLAYGTAETMNIFIKTNMYIQRRIYSIHRNISEVLIESFRK